MLSLLSKDRGDLDQRISVFATGKEEHFIKEDGIDLNIFTRAMAHWLLGAPNRDKIEPSEKIIAVALAKHKEDWYYWQATGSNTEKTSELLSTVYANIHHRTEKEAGRIVHASVLVFFNLGREERAEEPVAKVRFHSGGGSVLYALDCTTNEAAGLLYALRDCHIGVGGDIYTTGFFNFVQVKKAPPAEPQKKKGLAPQAKTLTNPEGLDMDAALYRKLQNFRLQSLL